MPVSSLPLTVGNDNAVSFAVRVMPRASRQSLGEVRDGQLVVYLNAPPVEGAANSGLIKFLAKTFKIAPSSVAIVSGLKNRNKVVKIAGMEPADILSQLQLV